MKINYINLKEKQLNFVKPIFESVFNETVKELNTINELEINVFFVSKRMIKKMNRDLRGVNKPTDVLSVPTLPLKPSMTKKLNEVITKEKFKADILMDSGNIYLGDVILCPKVIKKQAKEYENTNEREFAYMFVHSLLHLFGFNHEAKTHKDNMRKTEEKILEKLNLSRDEK